MQIACPTNTQHLRYNLMDRDTTCFFTGHRDVPEHRYNDIYNQTTTLIQTLYREGIKDFVCGGAVGFDTLAAKAVLELRELLDIRLHLVLPCTNQSDYFSSAQKAEYEQILGSCDSSETLFDHYFRGCMHARNRKMVEMSTACIAYCTKQTGGAAYTVKFAISNNLPIYFVK